MKKQDFQDTDEKLKVYLQQSFKEMLDDRSFHDALLPGHFNLYGNLAEDRIELFLDNIQQIIVESSKTE